MSANEAVLQPLSHTGIATVSKGQLWTGRILAIIAVLFMLMDGVMKIVRPPQVIQASGQMGYAASTLPGIGVALLLCIVLFVIPRTAVLGAALITGYLGGAVASQVRIGAPAFNNVFPILFAVAIWASIWLRFPQLRTVFPLLASERRTSKS
jgi:hypothetical protein